MLFCSRVCGFRWIVFPLFYECVRRLKATWNNCHASLGHTIPAATINQVPGYGCTDFDKLFSFFICFIHACKVIS